MFLCYSHELFAQYNFSFYFDQMAKFNQKVSLLGVNYIWKIRECILSTQEKNENFYYSISRFTEKCQRNEQKKGIFFSAFSCNRNKKKIVLPIVHIFYMVLWESFSEYIFPP